MVADEPRRARPSRRTLITGAAAVVGVAAAGTVFGNWAGPSPGWFGDDPSPGEDEDSASPGDDGFDDSLVDGIELVDKGFSAQPPRPGEKRPLVGVGARLRNTTGTALWITASYYPVKAGREGIPDEDGEGFAQFGYGSVPIPPADVMDSVGIGTLVESTLDVTGFDGLAVQLSLLDFDAKYQSGAQVVTASVTDLDYHSGDGPGVDFLTFTADNPGPDFDKADYMAHFENRDGDTIGGWHADRARWDGLEEQLPDGETEEYPGGTSTHTLPVWLPPKLKPARVNLYLWATV